MTYNFPSFGAKTNRATLTPFLGIVMDSPHPHSDKGKDMAKKKIWCTFFLAGLTGLTGFLSPPVSIRRSFRLDASDNPKFGLYEVQEQMLVARGEVENNLMKGTSTYLEANKPRGMGQSGGFGGSSKRDLKQEAKSHAKIIRENGVVRIDGVLPDQVVEDFRKFVFELRKDAEEQVKAGTASQGDYFADVLLRTNRCDLKIPIGPDIVTQGLDLVLNQSPVRHTIEAVFGKAAQLYELSCLISDPGSQRQVIHPDNPFGTTDDPVLLTCFIALQDIDISMGPTVWLPGTHSRHAHKQFNDETGENGKDELLRTTPSVLGALRKGSCAIFDSHVLHCGTANRGEASRALFYFSFRNPKVTNPGNPGSIRSAIGRAQIKITDLAKEVESKQKGKPSPLLDSVEFCF